MDDDGPERSPDGDRLFACYPSPKISHSGAVFPDTHPNTRHFPLFGFNAKRFGRVFLLLSMMNPCIFLP